MARRLNEGKYINHTPGSAVTAGDVLVIENLVAVADVDIAASALGAVAIDGNYEVACLSTDVVAQGVVLYWDAGNTRATLTASTHKMIGWASKASGNGVATVEVVLGRYVDT